MIRHAKIQEAEILTKISFRSKGYWGYPKEYYDIWADELTIGPDYIKNNDVFVFANDGEINGYYSIVDSMKKWDVNISVNIRQQSKIERPLICN